MKNPDINFSKRQIKKNYRSITGHFPSIKNNTSIGFESKLEKAHFLSLEFDNEVISYQEQPQVEICIEVKRKIGYLPEDVGFYDDMTGPENLIYTARLNGISDAEAKVRALELMEHVGLAGQMKKKTGKYSRGMRQRLGLADVLIKNPEIIILDEPTSGIDPAGVQEFIELIRQLSRKEGLTVLFSSHHLDQVQKVCDRVGLFNSGKLVTLIDMSDLKDKHQELSDIYNHYMEEGGERHE
jgi:ABC-2 type transport system ATP-binding protein